MKIWIVTLRSALDDKIVGAYLTEAEGRQRMVEVAGDELAAEPRPGAADLIGVALYIAEGAEVQLVDQIEFAAGPLEDAIAYFCRGLGWNGR